MLGIGFLLLVSLVVSTAIATAAKFFSEMMPVPPAALELVNFLVSFGTITCLFALVFKYVPDAKVDWPDTWIGATVTSFLFTIGKVVLGLYSGLQALAQLMARQAHLSHDSLVYYSAQIFLFGAEFTFVYSDEDRAKRKAGAQSVPAAPISKARSAAR